MRGEQIKAIREIIAPAGSPPLARGTVLPPLVLCVLAGITPACAGNRYVGGMAAGGIWDHPRLRGEQIRQDRECARSLGSPPLARGTGIPRTSTTTWFRITPACAGNSCFGVPLSSGHWDHPRLRGEQIADAEKYAKWAGSPPLARGTAARRHTRPLSCRITPACAGNSLIRFAWFLTGKDHPRLRGEQSIMCCKSSARAGSPPLARGTVVAKAAYAVANGITPACAGNSTVSYYYLHVYWDHPRLRGEQRYIPTSRGFCRGSPPLARGTATFADGQDLKRGITPACAGNSSASISKRLFSKDHPRLRGEQLNQTAGEVSDRGSPPLARGTVLVYSAFMRCMGITPACAGNRIKILKEAFPVKDHPRLRGEQGFEKENLLAALGSPPLARGTVGISQSR